MPIPNCTHAVKFLTIGLKASSCEAQSLDVRQPKGNYDAQELHYPDQITWRVTNPRLRLYNFEEIRMSSLTYNIEIFIFFNKGVYFDLA